MNMRVVAGRVLAVVGLVFGGIGLFVLEGPSIEFPGIILGGIGYYLGLTGQDRITRILGIAAVVLCTVSLFVAAFDEPPQ